MNLEAVKDILRRVQEEGRDVLLETEGLDILEAVGVRVPNHLFVKNSVEAAEADLGRLGGRQVVVKVISPDILHKSELGGVAVVSGTSEAVAAAVSGMEERLQGRRIKGFTLNQFVEHDPSLGGELLIGCRWTADFGPVVTYGTGGIYTEFISENFKPGRALAVIPADLEDEAMLRTIVENVAITKILSGRIRGQKSRVSAEALTATLRKFMALARALIPNPITELEVNPFVVSEGDLLALDALAKLGPPVALPEDDRPIHKLKNLLEPESVALIGVSERLNPGHIILNNLIREGFGREQIYIVKPDTETIERCRCYPDLASLPQKVDLFVVATAAHQVPEVITEVVELQKAESLIIIPGGLEEKEGSEGIVARMHEVLRQARRSEWRGPVINGGNCLGIRSHPGHIDTMFIPDYKFPVSKQPVSPVAFISQSGAFAVSKSNKWTWINPKYTISIGNQMDLTIGDYLTRLKDDPELEIFAVYVEGFKLLDGRKFLEAATEITKSGRTVILYRAGRTSAGAKASASHTASLAGDYVVTRELARSAGIILVDTVADFEDLTQLFVMLRGKEVRGLRLGAVSNAGFECVAMADNLGDFTLASFSPDTMAKLSTVFKQSRIDNVVDVHNPVDLTPMVNDAGYEAVIQAVLDDENVDVGIVGCVPMTPACNTLPPSQGHGENLYRDTSVVTRLIKIKNQHPKAWAAIVDGGPLYEPMVRLLEENGVPVFATADRALRLLDTFCRKKLRDAKDFPR
jgi:acyl-CoA synthetase (NDP forming)